MPTKFTRIDVGRVPELWVLRHGQTTWNAEQRLQGRLDSPLTRIGMQQARAQHTILRGADLPQDVAVISSPAGRALKTARIATDGMAVDIATDPNLVEIDMGEWQGHTLSEIRARMPGLDTGSDPNMWKFTGRGCESLKQVVARVATFLNGLDRPTVVVTHGVTSRVLRCLVLGLSPDTLSDLPGGQGVVHHLKSGRARLLHP
ncbi:MAG: histidine phosphatase family protein [Pseudomonadota bacterium]